MAAGGFSVPKRVITTASGTRNNIFGEALAVPVGGTSTIATFSVPIGKKFFLDFCEISGENHAIYEVLNGAIVIAKKITYFSGSIADEIFFGGLEFSASSVITLQVTQYRPDIADFSGRISGLLDDA